MGEDLVAERRRVMLLTRENEELRSELEQLRRALSARGDGIPPESPPELVGQ